MKPSKYDQARERVWNLSDAELIKYVRERENLTQADLAKTIGYGKGGQGKISNIERGVARFSGPARAYIRDRAINLLEADNGET